jgi:ethanolamine permease
MVQRFRGVTYTQVDVVYFEKRVLKRHAGLWSLWALGVGAVISGHYSGWNIGLATGGWGGMAIAGGVIAVMYLGLTFSIAEMASALPHTGGAYSFSRTAMGPWGGFLTGLAENVEYILTPAVIVFFIGTYLSSIFETPAAWQPLYWIVSYAVFVTLNVSGVALSFRVTVVVTLLALGCLAVFWISALPHADLTLGVNIGAGGVELPGGGRCHSGDWRAAARPRSGSSCHQQPLSPPSRSIWRDLPRGIILACSRWCRRAYRLAERERRGGSLPSAARANCLDVRGHHGDIAKVLALIAIAGLPRASTPSFRVYADSTRYRRGYCQLVRDPGVR